MSTEPQTTTTGLPSASAPSSDHPGPKPDAICFTAGLKGAPFGAGVIHAYLAADREAPKLVAGISMGALTAAVMQRCYRELDGGREVTGAADEEVRRWSWLRRYINRLTRLGLDVVWRSFPDPIDYTADRPPVVDLSVAATLREKEAEARRNYYLLTKLWRWVASLPLEVSEVADALVRYVRFKEEGYGGIKVYRRWRWWLAQTRLGLRLYGHLVQSPGFLISGSFQVKTGRQPMLLSREFRPLFGWRVWLGALLAPLLLVPATHLILGLTLRLLAPEAGVALSNPSGLWVSASALLHELTVFGWLSRSGRFNAWKSLLAHLARQLRIDRGLLCDYQLHRFLLELFSSRAADQEPALGEEPFPLLLVASPLQHLEADDETPIFSQQVIAQLGSSLVTALRASLALPFWLPPIVARRDGREAEACEAGERAEPRDWLGSTPFAQKIARLDLIDGAKVRSNPIPAVFSYLRGSEKGRQLGHELSATSKEDCRLHVVYTLPIVPLGEDRLKRSESLDVVDVGTISLNLAQRRDTKLEVRQTNFISRLELEIRKLKPRAASHHVFPIFADEIAPDDEIEFKNSLAPTRKELLGATAAGCRSTLERLYTAELEELARDGTEQQLPVECHRLLAVVAPGRQGRFSAEAPGMREVCRNCTRRLAPRPPTSSPLASDYVSNYGLGARAERLEHLGHLVPKPEDPAPRIAFVASGGVFRGATHVGVLAALCGHAIRPDLVVGASVGSLMGGVLAAATYWRERGAEAQGMALIGRLADTFLRVDTQVSLTRTLKNAAKKLSVSARQIDFSPEELRRLIEAGTRSDPGYAAVGAPPALIDALSRLFFLPHRVTAQIAARFVAGHYTRAAGLFWSSLQRETLERLEVRSSLMGVSLLKPVTRQLLGADPTVLQDLPPELRIDVMQAQPFHGNDGGPKISCFANTTKLDSKSPILLGRDFPVGVNSFDFLDAVLSSSAFPVVFAPRFEASVFPGLGRTDALFSDGGMFDNVPFMPTIEVLRDAQLAYMESPAATRSTSEYLRLRVENPYLFIAGALDASPGLGPADYDDLSEIGERAGKLKQNLKIASFDETSGLVEELLRRLLEAMGSAPKLSDQTFVNGIVHAGVLKVIPTDKEHLNPTFAFCRSTGLSDPGTQRAMADGCHQTLAALAEAQRGGSGQSAVAQRSVEKLLAAGRMPTIVARPPAAKPSGERHCPYFLAQSRRDGGFEGAPQGFVCPFVRAAKQLGDLLPSQAGAVAATYEVCVGNQAYRVE